MVTQLLTGARYKNVQVAGRNLSANLLNNVSSMSVELSNSAVSALNLTFVDTHAFNIYRSAVVNPGQTLTYEGWTFLIMELELGSGEGGPTVTLPCLSKRVVALTKQTGEKDWGSNADVSTWVTAMAKSVGFMPIVQPGIGKAEIKRAKPEGTKVESTWDIMTKLKDEMGAWLFEYGNLLVFAKPTWWAKTSRARQWKYRWNTYSDHSTDLLEVPKYSRKPTADRDKQESMTISVTGDRASAIRPGDLVVMDSSAPVGFKGGWIITSVDVGSTVRDPVAVSCQRIIDPTPRTPKKSSSPEMPKELPNMPVGPIAGWSTAQIAMAKRIVSAGIAMNVPLHGQRIAVMVAMGESSLVNTERGDAAGPDSCGLFQQRDPWGPRSDRMNPTLSSRLFYKALLKTPGWQDLPPTLAAHYTQGNADPNHYAKHWNAAVLVVDAIYAANRGQPGASGGPSDRETSATSNPKVRSNAQAWIDSVKGQFLDFDGAYGAQCVDVFLYYNRDVVGGPAVNGNGIDYYWNKNLVGQYIRLPVSATPVLGDVACWSDHYGVIDGERYGHVAIVIRDLGSWIECLSQRPGPARIMNLSKQGMQGYLRPKTVKPAPLTGEAPKQVGGNTGWKYT